MSNIKQLIEDFKKQQEEFSKKAKASLTELFKATLEAHPEIHFIAWTQYAPYFNDGEECLFSVHPMFASNCTDPSDVRYGEYEGEDIEEGEAPIWVYDGDYGNYGDVPANVEASLDELSEVIQSSEIEDVLHTAFGNHVRVVVTREGISTEEYDHD